MKQQSRTVSRLTRIAFEESPEDMVVTDPGTTTTTAGGGTRIRGMIMEGRHEANIPHLVGTLRMTANADYDQDGNGQMWAWWSIEARDAPNSNGKPVGGGWEGIWFADVTEFGENGPGHGFGLGTGIYEGARYFSDGVLVDGHGTATGYILVPA